MFSDSVHFKTIKTKLLSAYLSYSDLRHVKSILLEGFNFDIDGDIGDKLDHNFWTRFFCLITLLIIFCYQIIGSFIHWNNDQMTLIVGNLFKGWGIPKYVCLTAACAAVVFQVSLKVIMSIKLIKKDENFWFLMSPFKVILIETIHEEDNESIREITETATSNLAVTMSERIKKELRKELRPLIALVRYTFKFNLRFLAVIVSFFAFMIQSMEYVTTWKLIVVILWTVIYVLVFEEVASMGSSFLTIYTITHYLIITIKSIDREIEENVIEVLPKLLKVVNQIRKFNQTLSGILGLNMMVSFVIVTTSLYAIVELDLPIMIQICLYIMTPTWYLLYTFCIMFPSYVNHVLERKLSTIFRHSCHIDWTLETRYRINYFMNGMLHMNSFGGSKYVPKLEFMMIVWVRY